MDDESDRRFLEPASSSGFDLDLLDAFLLGSDMALVVREGHRRVVDSFLELLLDVESADFLRFVKQSPRPEDLASEVPHAFTAGYRVSVGQSSLDSTVPCPLSPLPK